MQTNFGIHNTTVYNGYNDSHCTIEYEPNHDSCLSNVYGGGALKNSVSHHSNISHQRNNLNKNLSSKLMADNTHSPKLLTFKPILPGALKESSSTPIISFPCCPRRRRRPEELDRKYVCCIKGCERRYVLLNSLQQHLKRFHGIMFPPSTRGRPPRKYSGDELNQCDSSISIISQGSEELLISPQQVNHLTNSIPSKMSPQREPLYSQDDIQHKMKVEKSNSNYHYAPKSCSSDLPFFWSNDITPPVIAEGATLSDFSKGKYNFMNDRSFSSTENEFVTVKREPTQRTEPTDALYRVEKVKEADVFISKLVDEFKDITRDNPQWSLCV